MRQRYYVWGTLALSLPLSLCCLVQCMMKQMYRFAVPKRWIVLSIELAQGRIAPARVK